MGDLTIYVRERDSELFARAQEWAKRHDRSLSWMIARALAEWLDAHP